MPVAYNWDSARSYTVSCSRCTASCVTDRPHSRDALTIGNADLVSETFRWIGGSRNAFHSLCKTCERAANASRRAAARERVTTALRAALGIARPFGVEFECAFPRGVSEHQIAEALRAEGLLVGSRQGTGHWYIKGDGTIHVPGHYGREIVSPVLRGEDGEVQIRKACRVFRRLGGKVNQSCGTHVHHDANDLTVEEIKRVARSWSHNSHLIDGLVAPSRRRDGNQGRSYAAPLTPTDLEYIDRVPTLEAMKRVHAGRYRSLNLTAYGKFGTLEIRQHQGTLDAEKVISWVRLGQAIIDTAKVGSEALPAHRTIRDFFGALAGRLDETAKTFLLGRGLEFGHATV